MLENLPPEVKDSWPAAAGSATAMLFMRRPFLIMIGLLIAGTLFAHFSGAWISDKTGLSRQLAGYVVGMFGMATVAKVHDTIAAFPSTEVGKALLKWIEKRLGV